MLNVGALAPKSALPLGAQRKLEESSMANGSSGQIVDPTPGNLLYSIVAVPWADTEDSLMESNIAGLLHM